uniref:HslU--HslV peptidase n=1 Tax=Paramoeba aestuarina TaxID=180227 RepID=A0A6U2XWN6_9EUKA
MAFVGFLRGMGGRGLVGGVRLSGVQGWTWQERPSSSFSSPSTPASPHPWHATTILAVRKNENVVIVGDGQVTQGHTVMKPNAQKVRRIGPGIIVGFAGVTADALCLFELLEQKLEAYPGQLLRACVEMAKAWRLGRELRRLEASMIVADKNISLTITGTGDVIQPHDGIVAIGSGGDFALACARGLLESKVDMDAEEIARLSMKVAADMCIYTNHNFVVEKLSDAEGEGK